MSRKILTRICRFLLVGVFLMAAIPKLGSPYDFSKIIEGYKILPIAAINPLAILLPWVEIVAAITLLIRRKFSDSALCLLIGLLLSYIVALGIVAWRGKEVDCGCFSVSAPGVASPWIAMVRDVFFLFLAVVCWFEPASRSTAAQVPPPATKN